MLPMIDDSNSLQKNTLRLFGLAGLLLAVTIVAGKLSLTDAVKSVDVRLFDAIVPRLQAIPGLSRFCERATLLGAIPISYAMITIGGLIVAFQRRRFGVAGLMVASILGAHLFQRIVIRLVDGTIPEGPEVIGSAGPYFSGGTERVIVVFGVLASVMAPRLNWSSSTVFAIATSSGVFEAMTRLVLGRHWPFDLLASFPIGLAIVGFFRLSLGIVEDLTEPPAHRPS